MIIKALRVRNYKALRDVHLTKMPRLAVFVGANGSGKSTLLDVFAFLQDCIRYNVDTAVARRGGTGELFSRESEGNLLIEFEARLFPKERRLVYAIELSAREGVAFVRRETLIGLPHKGRKREMLIDFTDTQGRIAADEGIDDPAQAYPMDPQTFAFVNALALDVFGSLVRYRTITALNHQIQSWACAPAQKREWRASPVGGLASERAIESAELTAAVANLQSYRRDLLDEVVRKLGRRVPGFKGVETHETEDKRVLLRFRDGSFKDPFALDAMSEGTRRLLMLYIMLNGPDARPLLTYEEPENDLYPKVMWPLAEEFRAYANRGSQVLVSTHSPDFVNALNLDEVYWMEKRDGYATVVRAADDRNVRSQNEGGGLMGSLWTEGFFGKAHPR